MTNTATKINLEEIIESVTELLSFENLVNITQRDHEVLSQIRNNRYMSDEARVSGHILQRVMDYFGINMSEDNLMAKINMYILRHMHTDKREDLVRIVIEESVKYFNATPEFPSLTNDDIDYVVKWTSHALSFKYKYFTN